MSAQTDEALPISIISMFTLAKLEVKYESCQRKEYRDSRSGLYVTFGRVKLRWQKVDKAKSYPEEFYVVEGATSFAVLGKTAKRA